MIDRIINTEDIKDADTVLFSVPYENGISFMSGTAKAPAKIIDCLDNYLELFDVDLLCEPAKLLKTAHQEITGLEKFIPEEAMKKISSVYQKFIDLKKFTILLGGAHTVSFGALKAISQKENPKDITILQIDAHQDLRDNNCDYDEKCEKFAHSCVMRRVHDLGFNLVQVGIRTFSKYEYNFEMENKKTITVFPWTKNSKIPKIEDIIKSIKTEKVYLSLDVDGIDPSFMPGTGTPVQGGLDWNYTLNLMEKLFEKKNVIGADIVEVSPQQNSVLTEFGASLLCYKMMTYKFKKKLLS
ncbi:MAG: agmatinase [Candidatus Nomurabacteria bacterium]|nr:agmatinase [Candidatus Nomurabacteria bacterium]